MHPKTNCLLVLLLMWAMSAGAQTDTVPKYPRVCTIYSKNGHGTEEDQDSGKRAIAKYNLYVSDMTWWGLKCPANYNCQGHAGSTTGQYLKYLNPTQIDLMYQHSVFHDTSWSAPADGRGYIIGTTPYYLDLRWLLCYAGSTLSAALNTTDTVVSVNDLSKFAVKDNALIGGVGTQNTELVNITYKSGSSGSGTLHVHRALLNQNGKFPAVTHSSTDYIRSVSYGFTSQGFMAFNMSSACPSSSINPDFGSQTYNQFIASFWGAKMTNDSLYSNLDGLFLDNFIDIPLVILHNPSNVDYTNVNVATSSPANNNYWKAGMADMAHQMQLSLPTGKLIVANTGDSVSLSGAYLNGGMIEGVDQNGLNSLVGDSTFPGDSRKDPAHFYNGWISGGHSPQTFIYNGSSSADTSLTMGETDYKTMRFLLTLTMMNNGYLDYDEFLMHNSGAGLNSGGHQAAWWYDEYDNAGAGIGYLGYPLSASTQPATGVFRRDFEKGVAICNTTSGTITVQLGKFFTKINGVQDHAVNDGSTVDSVTLQSKDGIILYDCSNVQPPTNLTLTKLPQAIRLDWTASTTPGVTSYSIYRGWLPGSETFYKSGITGTTFTDSVAPGAGYWYFMKAVVAGCDSSAPSNEELKYACPTVMAPTNLTATKQTGKIILNWNASTTPGVTYSIFRGWLPGSEAYYIGGLTDTTFTDSVTPGAGYWYYVNAVLSGCDSAASGEILKYSCPVVAAPANLTATAATGEVILNWNASTTPGVTYSIFRGWLPGSETYYVGGLTDTTFTDHMPSGDGYWYYVNAVLSGCDSAASNEKLKYALSHSGGILYGNGVSLGNNISDSNANYTISIYPNPSHGEIEIVMALPRTAGANVSICNSQGQVVSELTNGNLEAGIHNFTFHGGGLAKGIYFCRVTTGNSLTTYKLMIL
jgi:hypothetical protein